MTLSIPEKAPPAIKRISFVFVTNYPMGLLKFYHGEDSKNPGTGTNCSLLAPEIGEMVDGSQREPDLKKIVERLKKAKVDLGQAGPQ